MTSIAATGNTTEAAPSAGESRGPLDAMVDRLTAAGDLTSDVWRRAMHAVPRHLFAPDRIRVAHAGQEPYVVDRAAGTVPHGKSTGAGRIPCASEYDRGHVDQRECVLYGGRMGSL